jgi:hypothetical protein
VISAPVAAGAGVVSIIAAAAAAMANTQGSSGRIDLSMALLLATATMAP